MPLFIKGRIGDLFPGIGINAGDISLKLEMLLAMSQFRELKVGPNFNKLLINLYLTLD